MGEDTEAAHAGEQLQRLRPAAGMTVEEVAERGRRRRRLAPANRGRRGHP